METFIEFKEIQDVKTKTKQFYIENKASKSILGYVVFFPQWRKFVFTQILDEIIFDSKCLREIADFCDKQTNEWKESLKEESK